MGYDGEHKGTSNWGRYVSDQFCAASGDVQHVAFVAPDVIVECDPPGKMPGSSLRHASLHGDKHGEKLTENPSRNRRQKRESRSEVVKRRLTPVRRNRRPAAPAISGGSAFSRRALLLGAAIIRIARKGINRGLSGVQARKQSHRG